MEQLDIDHLNFQDIENIIKPNLRTDEIAVYADICELPKVSGTFKNQMFMLMACVSGRINLEINAKQFCLSKHELLVVGPNDIISDCMISPDFECGVICMSERGILEQISTSELWDRAFHVIDNPIIKIDERNIRMFRLYAGMLKVKMSSQGATFHKEAVQSIVKALLYDMLSLVDRKGGAPFGSGLSHQRDVQFKRFIKLLTDCEVRPRNLSWYADKMCLSVKRLSQISKDVSGKTALEWVNEYVIKDIQYWLKNSDKSIKEIAYNLDFPSISSFGKYCRLHFGISPTEYRKKLRDIPLEK